VEMDLGGTAHVPICSEASDLGTAVTLGVRPEDLTVTDGDPRFSGEISIVEALGETTLLYFLTKGHTEPYIAKLPGIHDFRRGQRVNLIADPSKLHLFDAKGKSFLHR
jgi:alpha-glucoside transport system ATP-binding protein